MWRICKAVSERGHRLTIADAGDEMRRHERYSHLPVALEKMVVHRSERCIRLGTAKNFKLFTGEQN